jgi:3-hydroxy-3-methylglutaryl CoA synthase/uncharacterized OB-fold protein
MSNAIISYGAYVPRHRLSREAIGSALGGHGGAGSRVVASFDEDSTTLGVEAARRALAAAPDAGAKPGSVYFATSAPVYLDKTNATAIHAALDLGHEGFAADVAGSPRSAIAAMRAAGSDGGLAVLSDLRVGRPGSSDELTSGDAAAAFLFGDENDAVAVEIGSASATAEFLDRWRAPGESASSQWEERFGQEMYMPLIEQASTAALAAAGIDGCDHAVVSSPHSRVAAAAAKRFAGDANLAEPPLGYAGAADLGVGLVSALDAAQPGETVLVVSAADGCDAVVYRATDRLPGRRSVDPVPGQLEAGREILYATYLTWRGMLDREPPRRPEPDRPAGPPSARSESWKFGFVGSACTSCGTVQVPPGRVCPECGAVDQVERRRLADAAGKIATFTVDHLAFSPSPPVIDVVVDFDGGGRYTLEMADASPDEVAIGTPVEMTFRRLYTSGGVHNYFWKARPTEVSANGE